MKTAFIIVLYQTPKTEVERLEKEIANLGLKNSEIYFIDNTGTKKGYAEGVNEGIKKGLKDNIDLFVAMNPDISLVHLRGVPWLEGVKHFDILGFAIKQHGRMYYGGIIDPWRLTGGLNEEKPMDRFIEVDFVSGSLIIIKKEVIEKIGLFDESYFMYYEDVDYCFRARKNGFRVGIDRNTIYEHFENPVFAHDREQLLDRAYKIFFKKYSTIHQKIYEIIHRILSSRFLINYFSLNLSSLIIKLTHFVNFLLLIRFLTAPEYGIYTLVWAQVTLLSPLADFGTTSYGVVHLPTEKEKTYRSLFSMRIFVSIIVFLATLLFSFLLFKGSSKIYIYILVTATVIFTNMFSGSYFILNAVRNTLYRPSRNSIIFNVVLVAAIAVSLFLTRRLLAVFLAILVVYNAYSLVNFFLIKKELKLFMFRFDWNGWLAILKKSYVFVLIGFFAGLYFKLDVFLLKLLKGETEVGIYAAGYKFFDSLLFLAASYNVTATPILARLSKNKDAFFKKAKKDFLFLSFIGFAIAMITSLFSPLLLPYFLKKTYALSIPILQIVIFALPLILINSVWINILYVLKKAPLVIFVFAFETIINFTLNWIFIPRYSYFASAYITVISEIINCFILVILVRYVWKKTFRYSH